MGSETSGFLARLTAQATSEKSYGADVFPTAAEQASVKTSACPRCGAGRAQQDGLTRCAYCGHELITQRLTDGIYLSSSDNSD